MRSRSGGEQEPSTVSVVLTNIQPDLFGIVLEDLHFLTVIADPKVGHTGRRTACHLVVVVWERAQPSEVEQI